MLLVLHTIGVVDIWLAIFELSCYAAWLVVGFSIDRIFWHILECCNYSSIKSVINSNNYKFKYLSFAQSFKLLLNKKLWLLAIYAGLMVGIIVNSFSELYDVLF